MATANQPQPEFVTVREVAAVLRCSVEKTRKLIYAGELESLKVGKTRLIRRSSLADFLERCAERGAVA